MFNRISNLSNSAVMMTLIGIAFVSSLLSAVVNTVNSVDTSPGWWVSWLQNFSTEMFGAFLTFVFIELIVGQREKRREEERAQKELKERLIRELGSSVNEVAKHAAEELRATYWLRDTSLHRADLKQADLQGADLSKADLQQADLEYARLQGTDLSWANLEKAVLDGANLQGAKLHVTNLRGAFLERSHLQKTDLFDAKLQGAFLKGANLRGANLAGANLQGAKLQEADLQGAVLTGANLRGADLTFANLKEVIWGVTEFDENTSLPDGSQWTYDTDMARFTDSTHPHFWRSDAYWSPAYRGKKED